MRTSATSATVQIYSTAVSAIGEKEEATYADLCTAVRDEIEHRLAKSENLPKSTISAR